MRAAWSAARAFLCLPRLLSIKDSNERFPETRVERTGRRGRIDRRCGTVTLKG
jgi:hypothetical protein